MSQITSLKPDDAQTASEPSGTRRARERILDRLRSLAKDQQSQLSRQALEARLQQLRQKGEPIRQEDREREAARQQRVRKRSRYAA